MGLIHSLNIFNYTGLTFQYQIGTISLLQLQAGTYDNEIFVKIGKGVKTPTSPSKLQWIFVNLFFKCNYTLIHFQTKLNNHRKNNKTKQKSVINRDDNDHVNKI